MTLIRSHLAGMRASIRPTLRLRSDRLWEIDALRGVAIIMMVIYHLLWDLQGLGGYDIDVYSGFWRYFQIATASLFTGIVGVSLTLSHARASRKPGQRPQFVRRGLEIFSWGIVVGLVTFVFDPARYVRFGILHLIGFSIVAASPLLRFRWLNLALGLVVIVAAGLAPALGLSSPWLDWLGLNFPPRPAFDYFPVLPWFGLPLIGVFLGNTFYANASRQFALPDLGWWAPVRWLRLMGQNSLPIYLLHQPILITLLVLLGIVRL